MATTVFREDSIGRKLVNPASASVDYLGRVTTSTVDFLGRALRRTVRVNATAWTLAQEIQYVDGSEYVVKTAGTSHATVTPATPSVGADVTDGTAVLTRTK